MTAQPTTPSPPQSDATAIAAIASLLVIGATVGIVAPRIASLLSPLGISSAVAIAAVKMAMSAPLPPLKGTPPATATGSTIVKEPLFRAIYIIQAARRINRMVREGKPVATAAASERRFYLMHRQAGISRLEAARQADRVTPNGAGLVGWYATMDSRTSPECRAANGKNFKIDERPAIGYPGSVHPSCRCRTGLAHAGGRVLVSKMDSSQGKRSA